MQFFLAHHMFMHISCIRTLSLSFCSRLWLCFLSLSLSLSFSDRLCMAPKCKSTLIQNLFRSGSSFSFDLPLLTFGSVMRRPIRTSRRTLLNMAFIRSAMWFYWTFSLLLLPMSFTLGDENLFVGYPWGVLPCSYRSLLQHARYWYLCVSVCHDI